MSKIQINLQIYVCCTRLYTCLTFVPNLCDFLRFEDEIARATSQRCAFAILAKGVEVALASEVEAVFSLIENEDVFDVLNRGVLQRAGNRPANAAARHSYVADSKPTRKNRIHAAAKMRTSKNGKNQCQERRKIDRLACSKLSVEFPSFYTLWTN